MTPARCQNVVAATPDRATMATHSLHAPTLAKLSQSAYVPGMTTMSISLPDALKSFVDEQVASRGYGTSSEYVRELIRKDQDRQRLRGLLLEGAVSAPMSPADRAYFDHLRERVRRRTTR